MATDAPESELPYGAHAPGVVLGAILRQTQRATGSWGSRRIAFALRRIGVSLLRGSPADVERIGCRLRLYPAGNTVEKRLLFTPDFFDREERALLAQHLTPDFTFADVGANVGGYALFVAARAGPGARILAIEPQPDIFARLTTNIRQNGFAQVVALNCAVSDRDEAVTLHIDPTNKGESSILGAADRRSRKHVTVAARRLGPLLAEAGFRRLDALKLDVEGVEDRILADFFTNGDPALWPALLVVEDAPTRWATDVLGQIEARGYDRVLKTATNLVYRRRV